MFDLQARSNFNDSSIVQECKSGYDLDTSPTFSKGQVSKRDIRTIKRSSASSILVFERLLSAPQIRRRMLGSFIMSAQEASRLEMELELLGAMYPEQACYDSKARELKYTQDGASLQLRLPELYPDSGLPDIIAANDASKTDLRSQTKTAIQKLDLIEGEETLDAMIAAFQQLLEQRDDDMDEPPQETVNPTEVETSRTVIIWLHHLLALSKRKLALSPASLSGITKYVRYV